MICLVYVSFDLTLFVRTIARTSRTGWLQWCGANRCGLTACLLGALMRNQATRGTGPCDAAQTEPEVLPAIRARCSSSRLSPTAQCPHLRHRKRRAFTTEGSGNGC